MFSLFLGNILVVTELIPRGSLESLLRSRHVPGEGNKYTNVNCEFNDQELLEIARQIAAGMQHLEDRKVGAEYDMCIVICFNNT